MRRQLATSQSAHAFMSGAWSGWAETLGNRTYSHKSRSAAAWWRFK
jgi:hypothetical protein